MFIAGDEVFNKLAKRRFMHGGQPNEPPVTVTAGSEYSADPAPSITAVEADARHNPALKLVLPSSPADVSDARASIAIRIR